MKIKQKIIRLFKKVFSKQIAINKSLLYYLINRKTNPYSVLEEKPTNLGLNDILLEIKINSYRFYVEKGIVVITGAEFNQLAIHPKKLTKKDEKKVNSKSGQIWGAIEEYLSTELQNKLDSS